MATHCQRARTPQPCRNGGRSRIEIDEGVGEMLGGTRNWRALKLLGLQQPNTDIPQGGGKREIRKRWRRFQNASGARKCWCVWDFVEYRGNAEIPRRWSNVGVVEMCRGLANGLLGAPKWFGGTPKCVCLRCGQTRDGIDKRSCNRAPNE
jgi:hypothetical protein